MDVLIVVSLVTVSFILGVLVGSIPKKIPKKKPLPEIKEYV
jgi:hypothetical protein